MELVILKQFGATQAGFEKRFVSAFVDNLGMIRKKEVLDDDGGFFETIRHHRAGATKADDASAVR